MKNAIKIVSGLAFTYGAAAIGAVVAGVPIKTSPQFWMQTIGSALGGALVFGSTYLNLNIKNLFKTTVPVKAVETNSVELEDLSALRYLSGRAKETKDEKSLALCGEMWNRFFVLHYGVINEKTNSNPSPPPAS